MARQPVNVSPIRIPLTKIKRNENRPLYFQYRSEDEDGDPQDKSSDTFNFKVFDTRSSGATESTVTLTDSAFTKSYNSTTGYTKLTIASGSIGECTSEKRLHSYYQVLNISDSQTIFEDIFPVE